MCTWCRYPSIGIQDSQKVDLDFNIYANPSKFYILRLGFSDIEWNNALLFNINFPKLIITKQRVDGDIVIGPYSGCPCHVAMAEWEPLMAFRPNSILMNRG